MGRETIDAKKETAQTATDARKTREADTQERAADRERYAKRKREREADEQEAQEEDEAARKKRRQKKKKKKKKKKGELDEILGRQRRTREGLAGADPKEGLVARRDDYKKELEKIEPEDKKERARFYQDEIEKALKDWDKTDPAFVSAMLSRYADCCDVSTPKNGTVFWSGGGPANSARAADKYIEQSGGNDVKKRLEHTTGAKWMDDLQNENKDKLDWDITKDAWDIVSENLAKQASGEVVVITCPPVSKNSVFVNREISKLREREKRGEVSVKILAARTREEGARAGGRPNRVPDFEDNFELTEISEEELETDAFVTKQKAS